MGDEGKAAGPQVEALMSDHSNRARSAAAETLGWIGYRESIPRLIVATQSQDWELVYQAAWSLGRLRALEARENLTQLRDGHWSYPVRMVAAKSLELLDQPLPNFEAVKERKVIGSFDNLQRLIHEAPTCEGEIAWHSQHLKLENNHIWPLPHSSKALPKFIPVGQGFVFQMDHGWLVGVGHGEFCGGGTGDYLDCGLHYYNSKGKHFHIHNGNVRGIYKTSNGLVFTEGLDHVMFNSGHVFKLIQSTPDVWNTQLLAITQAAPRKVAVAADGTLIVQTQGSVVAVTEGGKLQNVVCLDGNKTE